MNFFSFKEMFIQLEDIYRAGEANDERILRDQKFGRVVGPSTWEPECSFRLVNRERNKAAHELSRHTTVLVQVNGPIGP